jgi:hypothetical protein
VAPIWYPVPDEVVITGSAIPIYCEGDQDPLLRARRKGLTQRASLQAPVQHVKRPPGAPTKENPAEAGLEFWDERAQRVWELVPWLNADPAAWFRAAKKKIATPARTIQSGCDTGPATAPARRSDGAGV